MLFFSVFLSVSGSALITCNVQAIILIRYSIKKNWKFPKFNVQLWKVTKFMNKNMSTKFVHSIKVPRLYKESSKTVKKVLLDGASFKTLVFQNNHPNVQGIYALVSETLHHSKELESIIDKTKILIENPRFDPWLARVLITELLWGKKDFKSEAKPILTVLSYKEKLHQTILQNPNADVDPCGNKKVKLPRYVRVNTLLTSVDEALDAFYYDEWNLLPRCDTYSSHLKAVSNMGCSDFIQDFHIPEVFVFPPGTQFHNHPGYLNGKLLLQDKASCLSAFLLNPEADSEILDMCAAPGMKTTHLAAIINNSGKIYAVEMSGNRYKTLCDFVSHTNAKCIEPIQADALTISPEQYPNVKFILVDPSCSGSGMNRIEIRKPGEENLSQRLRKLQSLQSMILAHALLDFPNVKKVVYSTCSIYPEENECVVEEALKKAAYAFTLVNLKKKMNNEWHNFGSSDYNFRGEKCLYALPQKDLCNGFFVAMFKKKSKKQIPDEVREDYGFEVAEVQNSRDEPEEPCALEEDCNSSKKKAKKRKADKAPTEENQDSHNGENDENCSDQPKKMKKKKKDKCDAQTEER